MNSANEAFWSLEKFRKPITLENVSITLSSWKNNKEKECYCGWICDLLSQDTVYLKLYQLPK